MAQAQLVIVVQTAHSILLKAMQQTLDWDCTSQSHTVNSILWRYQVLEGQGACWWGTGMSVYYQMFRTVPCNKITNDVLICLSNCVLFGLTKFFFRSCWQASLLLSLEQHKFLKILCWAIRMQWPTFIRLASFALLWLTADPIWTRSPSSSMWATFRWLASPPCLTSFALLGDCLIFSR